MAERGPGDLAKEADYGITTASYNCVVKALAKVIADKFCPLYQ